MLCPENFDKVPYKKQIMRYLIALVICISCLKIQAQEYPQQEKVIQLIQKSKFRKVHNLFSSELSDAISAREMKVIWNKLQKQLGTFKSVGKTETTVKDERSVYTTPLYFEKGSLILKTSFDQRGRIDGIYFLPKSYNLPEYGKNLVYNKENLNIISGNYTMPGELLLPKEMEKKPPLVIFIHIPTPYYVSQ